MRSHALRLKLNSSRISTGAHSRPSATPWRSISRRAPACRLRAEEFHALSSVLDDLPEISPSPSFDAALRARIAAEPARRTFRDWMPSPRLAFAVMALVVMSVWLSSMPRQMATPSVSTAASPASQVSTVSDFSMIRDLPVLENFDVVSKFDALSELPGTASSAAPEATTETR